MNFHDENKFKTPEILNLQEFSLLMSRHFSLIIFSIV